jgi:hypothetical protein
LGFGLFQQTDSGRQIRQIVFHEFKVGVFGDTQLVETPEIDRAGSAIGAKDGDCESTETQHGKGNSRLLFKYAK